MMIRTAEDIMLVLRRPFDTPGPVIVGVHVDYSDNPKRFEIVRRQHPLAVRQAAFGACVPRTSSIHELPRTREPYCAIMTRKEN